MLQILTAKSEGQLRDFLAKPDFSFVFECGFVSRTTLANRCTLVKALWQHYTHYAIFAELPQFGHGLLSVLNFDRLIKDHPAKIMKLLIKSPSLDLL